MKEIFTEIIKDKINNIVYPFMTGGIHSFLLYLFTYLGFNNSLIYLFGLFLMSIYLRIYNHGKLKLENDNFRLSYTIGIISSIVFLMIYNLI